MSSGLARRLGFTSRADVLLTRSDGSRRIWIEFEISRADPVANHAKFAAAQLFEPMPTSDAFVSMVSSHVVRGRSNLAASAVYMMRAIGLSAFQTSLLPSRSPAQVYALNHRPLDELIADRHIEIKPEIERAIAVTEDLGAARSHRIHFAANLFEVLLNARAWNEEIATPGGAKAWGRRTVTYFVHDPQTGEFAPSKYCAFIPVNSGERVSRASIAMDMNTYTSLDESETRFDGGIAARHLTRRLMMATIAGEAADQALRERFDSWFEKVAGAVNLHRNGPVILSPPLWW